MVVVFALM